ncbi:hypothetical protein GQR58_019848 [Nymphon striatum]|nr:hypothetical protein GQR58_019848 [Nymphon striatum]
MVHIKWEYDLLDTFTNNGSTHDKVKRAGETFVLKLHGASNFKSLDKYSHIAYKMAIKRSSLSSSFQLASLPPTSAAAKQHACHTHIPIPCALKHMFGHFICKFSFSGCKVMTKLEAWRLFWTPSWFLERAPGGFLRTFSMLFYTYS